MTTTRKPTTKPRRAPARDVPQIRVTLHWAYWRFLYRHYRKLDKFTLPDTDREPLAEIMAEAAERAERSMQIDQAQGLTAAHSPEESIRAEKAREYGAQHATVYGTGHGFAVLTGWMAREMGAVAPSLTRNVWATCGSLLVPQIAAQDVGRGFEEQS
jgi:hypothetical protein